VTEENSITLVAEGVFKPLVKILSADNDTEAQRWAANVIAILTADIGMYTAEMYIHHNEASHRSRLAEAGGLLPLVSLLKADDDKVIRNAAFALGNACLDNGSIFVVCDLCSLYRSQPKDSNGSRCY
jgi:hypothetical protein